MIRATALAGKHFDLSRKQIPVKRRFQANLICYLSLKIHG